MTAHDTAARILAGLAIDGHTPDPDAVADVARRLATTDPETLTSQLIAEVGALVRATAATARRIAAAEAVA